MIHCDMLQTQQVDPLRSYDADQERTTVHLATPLPSNSKATLNIAFDGKLTGSMTGYYLSSYQVDGETKYHTVTQFQVLSQHPQYDLPKANQCGSPLPRAAHSLAGTNLLSKPPLPSLSSRTRILSTSATCQSRPKLRTRLNKYLDLLLWSGSLLPAITLLEGRMSGKLHSLTLHRRWVED